MERESFEDEKIGQILNEKYVPVKVDREERPDVDRVYMSYIQVGFYFLTTIHSCLLHPLYRINCQLTSGKHKTFLTKTHFFNIAFIGKNTLSMLFLYYAHFPFCKIPSSLVFC